jgi:hypothetical protein
MGRQWNQIIESLGPLTGGTVSINANLGEIDALLTTLQADVADGIKLDPTAAIGGQLNIASDNNGSQPSYGVQIGWQTPLDDFRLVSKTYPLPVSNESTSTSGGTGPTTFTSTTYGTIATANADRKGLTIYNEGSGNLHVTLGTATTSTSSYTVKIIPTAYYEVPYNYTGLIGGIFATAGTARVTQLT